MPRNGSGIYTLPGGNPVTPGDVIEAEWANTTLEDVADALTNSLSRTGAGGMLAPFRIADGTVSGPGLSYLNETNTGLYRSGAGSTWMAVLGVNTAQFSTVGLTIPFGKALTAAGNASVAGTFSVGGATTLGSTLAVTGALTATGGVSGNVTGNVTAATGTSTFNDVVITGALDMTAGSSATITGLSTPTNASDAANKGYVDTQDALRLALTGGTMSGAIAMGNSKITGLATPTADADAATKAYVDSIAQGIDAKASCRAATTANITLSGNQTIDGVAVIAGDRVLVKNQSSAAENGIYVAAASTWSRASDANTWDELVAAYTFIENGTDNGSNGYICTIAPGGTLGTTPVTWAQFSGAGQINAGTGMSKTGNTLNVNTASSARIVVGADEIDLATTGVIADTYKSVTVDQWGRVTGGTNPTTLAGFGIGDAYTKTETNSLLAAKLSTTGGTMSGALAMGTNKITGLGDPTLAQDAATKNYIDTIFGSTTTAAASAAAAASSASAASSSASSASGSATAAAASATSAAASFDSFDDRYLGAKTSDPTVDNDGNALITGALYFNSVANEMRVYNGSAWLASYIPATGYAQLAATNTFTANQVISANTANAALSITQAGSGNALYIEDVAADATPFVVSSTGAVGIGTTTPDNVTSAGIALVSNDGYYPQVVNRNKSNDSTASYLVFDKDRAGASVQNGDALGAIVWRSFDGANYLQSSAIIGYSDGTPGTNDVPGSLSFFTTADGASSPTERLKIANTGALAVSSSYGTAGQVLTSGGSGAAPAWTTISSSPTLVRSARTSNTILGTADASTLIAITSGTFTQTFTAAATLGSGWFCYIQNQGTGEITLDPNASETIDGLTSYIMYPGEARLVQCDGTGFNTVVLTGFTATYSSGANTFTKPPGYKTFEVELWGGGGGGAGGGSYGETSSTGVTYSGGGGGGGGKYASLKISASEISATTTVTVGAGGTAGTTGNTYYSPGDTSWIYTQGGGGGSGSSTTFGSLLIAQGGSGGSSPSPGSTASYAEGGQIQSVAVYTPASPFPGYGGGRASGTVGEGYARFYGGAGGGAGGYTSSSTNGAAGGGSNRTLTTGGGASGGTGANNANGNSGSAGGVFQGGGGGGSSGSVANGVNRTAGSGGAGGRASGGGGGGGVFIRSSANTSTGTSGAGGAGGAGYAQISGGVQ